MNGVRRSGYMSESRIWYSRCAGYRNGDYSKTLAMETIGFRCVNGVNRGGAYDNTNHAQYTRICYRQQRVRRGLAVWVGFR